MLMISLHTGVRVGRKVQRTRNKQSDESGIILVVVLFAAALMIFGYVVINSISKSREAEQIKDSATDAVEAVNSSVDAVNDVRDKASELLGN